MDINYGILTHPETGFVAFMSYLWGNGAIGRFISRLNQYLMFFSFIITAIIYVNRNRKKAAIYLMYTILILFIGYIVSLVYFYD